MRFTNPTAFPAFAFETKDQHDSLFHVVVVRMTFDWALRGGTGGGYRLRWAEPQDPLVMGDVWEGAPGTGTLLFESDLAPYKPRCDVVIHGDAHAPGGQPAARWPVEVTVDVPRQPEAPFAWPPDDPPMERLCRKELVVTGPRSFRFEDGAWRLSEPEPVAATPLQYAMAYGGEQRPPEGAPAEEHIACPTNTLGRGYLPASAPAGLLRRLEQQGSLDAPRIESPDDPVTDLHAAHALQGLGFVPRHFQPRLALAGTYDEAWKAERWPGMPLDFDFGYWNGAHPDLQVPHFVGGAVLTLLNLTRPGLPGAAPDPRGERVTLEVPSYLVRVEATDARGERFRVGMPLDTLVIDAEQLRAYATFRVAFPVDEEVASAELLVDDEARLRRLLGRGVPVARREEGP